MTAVVKSSGASYLVPVAELDLDRLAREIRREHEAAQRAFETAVEHAVRCGQLLRQAKGLIEHGEWYPWLAAVGLPARTATHYMTVAAKSANLADLPRTIGEVFEAVEEDRSRQPELERAHGRHATNPPPEPPLASKWRKLERVIATRPSERTGRRSVPAGKSVRYEPFPQHPRVLRQEIASCEARLRVLKELLANADAIDGVVADDAPALRQ